MSYEEAPGGWQSPRTAAQEAVEPPALEMCKPQLGSSLCPGVSLLQHRAGGDLQRDPGDFQAGILALFYQLGSAVASVHPQGSRQFNVIAEGAEIVP